MLTLVSGCQAESAPAVAHWLFASVPSIPRIRPDKRWLNKVWLFFSWDFRCSCHFRWASVYWRLLLLLHVARTAKKRSQITDQRARQSDERRYHDRVRVIFVEQSQTNRGYTDNGKDHLPDHDDISNIGWALWVHKSLEARGIEPLSLTQNNETDLHVSGLSGLRRLHPPASGLRTANAALCSLRRSLCFSEHPARNGLRALGRSSNFALSEVHRYDIIVSVASRNLTRPTRHPRRAFSFFCFNSIPLRSLKFIGNKALTYTSPALAPAS